MRLLKAYFSIAFVLPFICNALILDQRSKFSISIDNKQVRTDTLVGSQQDFSQNDMSNETYRSDSYKTLTFNGAWSWFTDPRAVYFEGDYKRTYTGWIDNYGDVHVAFYDHDTEQISSQVVYDNLGIDDHNNPSILIDEKGVLRVFFTSHSKDDMPIYMLKSKTPEQIQEWQPIKSLFLNDLTAYPKALNTHHTYNHPVCLSKENNKMFLFWRGVNRKPTFSYSVDNGDSWTPGKILFLPNENDALSRPYTKVYSNGKSKIHFTFTNAHPAETASTKIYYVYYENGNFYKANGDYIKSVLELPLKASDLDIVYDAKKEQSNAWNWDLAEDKAGNPVVVFAKFKTINQHIYCYAFWDGNTWKIHDIVNSGSWFPNTDKGEIEPSPHYSGGITIDHETPNIVYMSIKQHNVFEIVKWETRNKGKSWVKDQITSKSSLDNVRPYAILNAEKDNPLQVLWMQNRNYKYYSTESKLANKTLTFEDRFHSTIKGNILNKNYEVSLNKEVIINIMRELLDWQMLYKPKYINQDKRTFGQFFYGVKAYYDLSQEERYLNENLNIYQYEIEEQQEEIVIEDLLWLYNLKDNRKGIERIDNLKNENLADADYLLVLSGLVHYISQLQIDFENRADLKQLVLLYFDKLLQEKTAKVAWDKKDDLKDQLRNIERDALEIYSLAWGIKKGWVDKKYQPYIEMSFKNILRIIAQKDYKNNQDYNFIWNIQTTGSCLLAAKEISYLLGE